jgi:hypothetical protein
MEGESCLEALPTLEHLLRVIANVFHPFAISVPSWKAPKLKALSSFGTHGTRGTPLF